MPEALAGLADLLADSLLEAAAESLLHALEPRFGRALKLAELPLHTIEPRGHGLLLVYLGAKHRLSHLAQPLHHQRLLHDELPAPSRTLPQVLVSVVAPQSSLVALLVLGVAGHRQLPQLID